MRKALLCLVWAVVWAAPGTVWAQEDQPSKADDVPASNEAPKPDSGPTFDKTATPTEAPKPDGGSKPGEAPKPDEAPKPVIVAPTIKEFVNADYPPEALKAGVEAKVLLKLDLDVEGKVTKVEILQPVGQGFDEAAAAAAAKFAFTPATADGVPIPVRIQFVYHFRIEKKEVKTEEGQVIEGQVKERGVGLPVVGAEISVKEREVNTTTDSKGKFSLRGIPPGTYTLVVTNPEYKILETPVEVQEGKTLQVALAMDPSLENPYETVVVGQREETVVTKYVLEQRTLETVPGTFGDPVRVVETLPGVARAPYGVGILVIRGAMPNESKVFIDGVQIPLLYHFLGGPSVLNPNFLDTIGYFPGNFPSRYGLASGGVIEVNTKSESVEKWGGEADINLLNIGGYVEGKIGEKGSLRLGVRRSYVDAVVLAALEIAGESGTTIAPYYYDYQAEFDYQLTDSDRFKFFAFGSYDALELVTTDEKQSLDIQLSTSTQFLRLVPVWQHVGEGYSLETKPYFGWDAFGIASPGVNLYVDAYVFGLRSELKLDLAPWASLTTGVDGLYNLAVLSGETPVFNDYYIPGGEITSTGLDKLDVAKVEQDIDDWTVGWYCELKLEPFKGFAVTPGVRLDYLRYSSRSHFAWDPRLVVRYGITDWLAIKGGVGKFSQEPDYGARNPEYGNPDIDPSWAMHYSGGFEFDLADQLTLDMVGFYVRRHDLVVQSNQQVSTGDSVQTVRYENSGAGQSYGMEVILKYKPTKRFYGWLAYTLSRSELWGYLVNPGDRDSPADPDEVFPNMFDQTHILSLVSSVKLGRGWETGLRLRFVTGNPTTPIEQGVFVGDTGVYTNREGKYLSSRLPNFFQVDFRMEKQWTFETWALTFYLDIQNVTNHPNTEFQAFDYRFRESWNVPGIPFFPSFGLNGRF